MADSSRSLPRRQGRISLSAPGVVAVTGLHSFLGQQLVDRLLGRTAGLRVIGLDLRRPMRFSERAVLVFGRESEGFPAAIRQAYRDRLVSIPMFDPELRSLNVSTCVGIALYEVLRQQSSATKKS